MKVEWSIEVHMGPVSVAMVVASLVMAILVVVLVTGSQPLSLKPKEVTRLTHQRAL
jgi:hypothetical protein